jgi:HD-GYP domain-containing protein (c-di-GMP phosphodiesterase class II)
LHCINNVAIKSISTPIKYEGGRLIKYVTLDRTAPICTLNIVKKMKNPNGNPLLKAIKQFADNPQKLQEELTKLLKDGPEKVCEHLLDILAIRSKNTVKHVRGVTRTATNFAEYIGLSSQKTKEIKIATLVHDIGKIFTPPEVLNKPGKLNDVERTIMAEHAPLGKLFLKQSGLTRKSGIFKNAAELAEKHHYSVDKLQLSKKRTVEEEILELSDVWDALRRKRPYKKGFSVEDSLRIMQEDQKNKNMWNPDLFEKFTEFVGKTYCKK